MRESLREQLRKLRLSGLSETLDVRLSEAQSAKLSRNELPVSKNCRVRPLVFMLNLLDPASVFVAKGPSAPTLRPPEITMPLRKVDTLTTPQITELHELYRHEW